MPSTGNVALTVQVQRLETLSHFPAHRPLAYKSTHALPRSVALLGQRLRFGVRQPDAGHLFLVDNGDGILPVVDKGRSLGTPHSYTRISIASDNRIQ